tara:strand:+ start:376 stop:1155 length:780 start_codon:yes stop_codon:yes gene_type:complete
MKKVGKIFKILNSRLDFTYDKSVIGRDGVYSFKEWHKTRKANDKLFSLPSDRNYRKSSYLEFKKVTSASNLCKNFDFSGFKKLGDIGGVPFYQALVISDFYPNLQMLLTDYDHDSCELLKSVSYFSSFKIQSFNAKEDNYNLFKECDILTCWGVDYALDDQDILKLFNYIKEKNKTLLIATIDVDYNYGVYITKQIIKIKRIIKTLINLVVRKNIGKHRFHGRLRNAKYFYKLSKMAEVTIENIQIDLPKLYRIYKVTR